MEQALTSRITAPPSFPSDSDRLRTNIFSLLESNFLFGRRPTDGGKVRVLSIDGGGGRPRDALLAAAALVKLEAALQAVSGDPDARIADFFDAAAGAGAGGFLTVLTFVRGADGRPRFSAPDAMAIITRSVRRGHWTAASRRSLMAVFDKEDKFFKKILGRATLKDTVKAVLVPCYDVATSAPFVFSRADAIERDSFDFFLSDVCAATCAGSGVVCARSLDARTVVEAVGGAAAGGNPTAAAITHVLHNKQEFPLVTGVEGLFVVSIGTGEFIPAGGGATPLRSPLAKEMARITAEGVADMIDQAVAMAFGRDNASSYVRIQAAGAGFRGRDVACPATAADITDGMLFQRSVESVLFGGRHLSPQTNADKLDAAAKELVKEQTRRRDCAGLSLPNVVLKQVATPPRSSSASSLSMTATTRTSLTSTSSPATPSTCRRSSFFGRR